MSKLWDYIDARALVLSDGVATAGAVALAAILALWLSACAQIGQFSAADARNAGTIATAVGDSPGAACWPVLEATDSAISAAGDKPGVLTGIEEKRAVQLALQYPACQTLWAGLLAELLKATPAAPFVP